MSQHLSIIRFAGSRPSGIPHLGNIIQFASTPVDVFMIADLHAATEGAEVRSCHIENLVKIIKHFHPQCIIFLQSHMAQHHLGLAYYLATKMGTGHLNRIHTNKREINHISIARYLYPLLMAADILLYSPMKVVIGRDQGPHYEFFREACSKVGLKPNLTATTDTLDQPLIYNLRMPQSKMSSSEPNKDGIININDTFDAIIYKFRKAITSTEVHFSDTSTKNLLHIYIAVTRRNYLAMERVYMKINSWKTVKYIIGVAVAKFITPINYTVYNVDHELHKGYTYASQRANYHLYKQLIQPVMGEA